MILCETIVKRDDGEDEDEDDTSAQEAEAGEPAPEQEVIAKEGNDDEEYITRGQDLTELVPEEITNSGSDQEPTSTTTAEESEPTSKPEDEDKEESKDKNGLDEEPTPAPIPDDTTTITEEPEPASATDASEAATTDADAVPEPTDPAVAITSSTKITDSSQDRPSGQTDLTVTKASKNEEAGPTTLPKHKEETNSNTMALTVGVIIAAIVIASVIGIWIFRKWKLFPSRQFKSKIIGGSAKKEKATAAAVYGPGNGHDDRSEYNSRDEIFRPEVYEIEPEPPMTSVTMTTPAYPAAVAGSEYEYGYAHYEKMQQQQQPMSGDTNYQPYQYGYNSGVPAMSEASEMRASVTTISNPKPNVIGGVPATGHNIHGYGSEDYTQNDHFLRELRE
ncbi:hypothetical protein BG015_011746 [Linnemannia schmuckeri]|uniref:Uncharacterized protein n=1 Tax=Linnemannia schmuckeri TaxID=64567 RepID=A0A9P5S750_9FUNG|nr:hypothetical protein BG015_011746 [Linnemannia schmuckeri]